MTRPRLVYIIGPIRAANRFEVLANIDRAKGIALEVWRAGHIAVCPHLNSGCFEGVLPREVFLLGDLHLLAMCDDAILLEGYKESDGSLREIMFASNRSIPTWASFEDFLEEYGKGPLAHLPKPTEETLVQRRCKEVV